MMRLWKAVTVMVYFVTVQITCGEDVENKQLNNALGNQPTELLGQRSSSVKNSTISTKSRRDAVEEKESKQLAISSQLAKVLEYKNFNIEIEIHLRVSLATSTSIYISWNATVNRFHFNHRTQENFKNSGMKINYRPFGNLQEKEIILFMETADNQRSFNFSSEYTIEGLLPNNGYIFCFSSALDKVDSKIFPNISEETFETENPESSFRNFPSSDHRQEESQDPVFYTSKDFVFGKLPLTRQPFNPFISSIPQKSQEPMPDRKQNVAYSSTGELIYLPSSSWSPFSRRKRTLKYTQEFTPDGVVQNDKSKYCLEIFTRTETAEKINNFALIIISISVFSVAMVIIITTVLLVKCLRCCKIPSKNIDSNHPKTGDLEVKENSIDDVSVNKIKLECKQTDSLERATKEEDAEMSQKIKNCVDSTNENNKCIHELTKLQIDKKDTDFHPGYEIPPSSMVEVYGYDFPRPQNRSSDLPLSPAPSSCDLNDQVTDFSWDTVSNKYNLNFPGKDNKISELNKDINNSVKEGTFDKVVNQFGTYHSSSPASSEARDIPFYRKKPRPPSYEAFRRSEGISKLTNNPQSPKISNKLDDYPYQICSYDSPTGCDGNSDKQQNVGDIVITGGMLVEVPDGYARLATPRKASARSILRIIVR